MKALKIIFVIIVIFIIALFMVYGTISPCDILKKDIARQAGAEKGGQAMYALFGGFVERGINTLSPAQCVIGIYKVKTKGINKTVSELLK